MKVTNHLEPKTINNQIYHKGTLFTKIKAKRTQLSMSQITE